MIGTLKGNNLVSIIEVLLNVELSHKFSKIVLSIYRVLEESGNDTGTMLYSQIGA